MADSVFSSAGVREKGPRAGVAIGLAAVATVLYPLEPDAAHFVPVLASFALVTALAFLLSDRIVWSLALASVLFTAVYAISTAKYAYVAMKFHVYDIVFHALSWTQVQFFIATFPAASLLITFAGAAIVAALVLLWRHDRPGVRLRTRVAVVALAATVAAPTTAALFDRRTDFFIPHRYVLSSFLYSFGDLPQLMRIGGLMEASAAASDPDKSPAAVDCAAASERPDIILFLNESVMPPGIYPEIVFPAETAPMFASFDGRVRRLRVETFGGATWLSDFSVLTGLSTWFFGTTRNFVLQFTAGRLHHSLPQYLKACGYDTTMIYPSRADFAGSDRFYRSIGFDRIIDRRVHGAPDDRQRDAFYYEETLRAMRQATPGRPQFIVASGMATHSPWDYRFAPEAVRADDTLVWNGDRQTDEFMWRLVLAERDRVAFRRAMAAAFPDRPVLFVSYGDHQPALRRIPLRDAVRIADEGRAKDLTPTSVGFETYYALDAQNFTPRRPDPDPEILDIPYLSTVIVAAAGLPLDPVFERRRTLLALCEGRYFTCPYRPAVLKFHRWLADSGRIDLN